MTSLRPSRAPNMVGAWIEVVQPARYPWLALWGAGAVLDRLEEHEERPCEYQTHRDPRQSRALSYLSQAGLCTTR